MGQFVDLISFNVGLGSLGLFGAVRPISSFVLQIRSMDTNVVEYELKDGNAEVDWCCVLEV
jgi:hypothetical protein